MIRLADEHGKLAQKAAGHQLANQPDDTTCTSIPKTVALGEHGAHTDVHGEALPSCSS